MFYCEACRTKQNWPRPVVAAKSFGPCELCGAQAVCYDAPPPALPCPPPGESVARVISLDVVTTNDTGGRARLLYQIVRKAFNNPHDALFALVDTAAMVLVAQINQDAPAGTETRAAKELADHLLKQVEHLMPIAKAHKLRHEADSN